MVSYRTCYSSEEQNVKFSAKLMHARALKAREEKQRREIGVAIDGAQKAIATVADVGGTSTYMLLPEDQVVASAVLAFLDDGGFVTSLQECVGERERLNISWGV